MAGTEHQIWSEVARLRHALADRFEGLDDKQWDEGSWCPGWRVRDVLGHLVYLAEATRPSVLRDAIHHRVLPDRMVDRTARELGAQPVPALVQRLRTGAGGRFHLWGTPPAVALGEVLVHGADALRALGGEPEVPPDRVGPVLVAYRRLGGLAFHAASQRGVRLMATDLDWTTGHGPVVEGRAIDLALLMANRRQVRPQLSGPGVARFMAGDGRGPNWVDRTQALWRVGNRIEAFQLRRLGVSPMALLNRGEVLVIETTGRRSGRRRVTPVGYWRDAQDAFLVGGGAAGKTRLPDWVANLRADDSAAVWVRRTRIPVMAQELKGADRDRAQQEAAAIWPGVARYERLSGRVIPYFRLVPTQ
jgi:deazaflavin-dependent oxidoreductase (nitroreductase family)